MTKLTKKEKYTLWMKLPPVYFPKWVWEQAVHKQPYKYENQMPVYENKRVILT